MSLIGTFYQRFSDGFWVSQPIKNNERRVWRTDKDAKPDRAGGYAIAAILNA